MTALTIRQYWCIPGFLLALLGCSGSSNRIDPYTSQQTKDSPVLTSVQWMDSLLDLGKIPMGDTVMIRFRFRNTGSEPLFVKNCLSSCSCTRIIDAQNAIPPGAIGEISAVYDTRKSIVGAVYKGLQVTMNTLPASRILRYKAEVTGHKNLSGIY